MSENETKKDVGLNGEGSADCKSDCKSDCKGENALRGNAGKVCESDDRSCETESLTFRQAMSELDAIVKELDSNTLELEESLQKYERGVALVRTLKVRLNEAQQKVDVLMGELEPSASDEEVDTTLS